uniref:Uncharacterized protein n=1 Tax=Anguilla anguilla TaxID=7936 RepID=A0A0E9R8L7_ANGAN
MHYHAPIVYGCVYCFCDDMLTVPLYCVVIICGLSTVVHLCIVLQSIT